MVGSRGLAVVVVGVTLTVLGCSDGEVSAEAIAQAEALAESVLLTVGDLPGLGWEVSEVGGAEGGEVVRLVPPEEATPAPWAEACGLAEQLSGEAKPAEGTLTMRARNFVAFESSRGGGMLGVSVSAVVFESADDAEAALERRAASSAIPGLSDEGCREAIAAEIGIDAFDVSREDLADRLKDSVAFRQTSSFTSDGQTDSSVTETHLFVRGRVMGSYVILGGDESPREIDHEGLLAVFESRVVAAQE